MSAADEQPSRVTGPRGGWPAALGVAVLVGAATLALPATLGYDAWAWTVWGRQLAHLDLATTAGPSFKPLPVLALAPLSVLGAATPVVWMGLMRAAAVLSLLLAYRLGARLAGPAGGRGRRAQPRAERRPLPHRAAGLRRARAHRAHARRRRSPPGGAARLGARAHRAGRAHPPRGVGPARRLRRVRVAARAAACARWPRPPWSCRRCCGWAWTGSARATRCTPARPRRRPPRAARRTPACRPSRSCAARRTRSSSPRSCWRRSGWRSRCAAATARCCRWPRSRWAGSRWWRSWPRSASPAPGATWRRPRRRCASWPASGSCGCSTPSASAARASRWRVAIAVLALVPALLRAREDARMLSVARSQADQRDELRARGGPRRRPRGGAARRAARDQPLAADGAGLGARRAAVGRAGDVVVVAAPSALGAAGARVPRPGAARRPAPGAARAASRADVVTRSGRWRVLRAAA